MVRNMLPSVRVMHSDYGEQSTVTVVGFSIREFLSVLFSNVLEKVTLCVGVARLSQKEGDKSEVVVTAKYYRPK